MILLHPSSSIVLRWMVLLLLGASITLVSATAPSSVTGSRLLVVTEDAQSVKSAYSQFLGDLEGRGYEVNFQSPKDDEKKLSLLTHGERAYDHVILFPPKSKGYGPALTPQKLVEFADKEGNLLVLTSPAGTTEQARELARELDVDLPPRDFVAADHMNFDALSAGQQQPDKHQLILVPRPAPSPKTRNYFSGGGGQDGLIAFRGAGHALGNRPLLFPILSASRSAYTFDAVEDAAYAEQPWAAGTQMHYVTGLQARNNARIVISGSADMLSNEFFDMEVQPVAAKTKAKTANRAFAREITQWAFKEIGVVKVVAVRHRLANATDAPANPHVYRIKNDISFEIELSEWAAGRWIPFEVPADDSLQLEFTMLDPYYRLPLLPLSSTAESRTYAASFRAPDQHGIFAFRVNYKRPFVTYVDEKHTVTVRHFAHDEYTRSWAISAAWVWIAGIAVTIAGWMVFCALWLYSAPPPAAKKTQ